MAAQYFFDVIYSLANCLVCFPSSPQLKINSRSFKMLRLLGEVSSSHCAFTLTSSGIPIPSATFTQTQC
jgi:serine/threonine kinase 16